MDAVNPDYMVVRLLWDSGTNVPMWVMPGNLIGGRFPLLVQIYHGALPYYLGLPAYAAFGTGLLGIRVAGALFGVALLTALALFARSLRLPALAAAGGLAILATDPAFVLGLRTQFYIKMIPAGLVLMAIGLMARQPLTIRALAAGALAGLAVHGYFIHAFAVAAVTLVLLAWPALAARAKLAWLGGMALGFLPSVAGFALIYTTHGNFMEFHNYLKGAVKAQSPGESGLGLMERAGVALHLAKLAWQGTGARLMALGESASMPGANVRVAGLVLVVATLFACLAARPDLRPGVAMLLAATLGFLGLGLTFGDRLWAHHFSPTTLLFAAGATVALAALAQAGRGGMAGAMALGVALIGANLVGWRVTLDALQATGGRGLSSDAIIRFAEDVGAQPQAAAVAPVDWGVFMPLAMVTRGAVPLNTDFDPEWVRRQLCEGRDVLVPLLAQRQPERIPGWSAQVGVGEPAILRYATRDGQPVLEVLSWRATRDAC